METAVRIIDILIGGGILVFVEFLIKRHDAKNDVTKDILRAVAETNDEVAKLKEGIREEKAIRARTQILRFKDELYNKLDHSQEYFEQVLDDIDAYNKYCDKHPDFSNGRTKIAAEYINSEYLRLFKEHKL